MIHSAFRVLRVFSYIVIAMFALACGSDNDSNTNNTLSSNNHTAEQKYVTLEKKILEVETKWDDSQDAASNIYNAISKVLEKAYDDAGKPVKNIDTMDQVKAHAWHTLIKMDEEWPEETAFAVSAQPDHLWVSVSSQGKDKAGEWRP